MTLNYMTKGKVKVNMTKYIQEMIDDSPIKIKTTDKSPTPANDLLFHESKGKN